MEWLFFNKDFSSCSFEFAIIEGTVTAAMTPIITRAIRTSDNVKAFLARVFLLKVFLQSVLK